MKREMKPCTKSRLKTKSGERHNVRQREVIAPNDDLELLEERRSVYVAIQYSIRYHRSLQDTLTCRVLGSGGVGPADQENIILALSSLSSLSRYTWPSRIILTEAMSGCVAK